MTAAREVTAVTGARGERLAAEHLVSLGYQIVARNHRCAGGEVDLIAWDGRVLCFVEVRARTTEAFGDPLETIDRRKQQRIIKAARHYLGELAGAWPELRFDAVGVLLEPEPRFTVVRGAFEV